MTILVILAVIISLVGIAGSVVPGIPGPPLSWLGLLLAYFAGAPITMGTLGIWLVITTIATVLDYILPGIATKYLGGHKAASTGAIVGLFVGMFVPPIGIIVGSILGAFIAEFFVEGSDVWGSTKAAFGAFLGFIATTGMKLIVCGLMLYKTFSMLFFA